MPTFFCALASKEILQKRLENLGDTEFVKKERKTRAIAVQLLPETVKRLDDLATRSGISRHRYMILILERAIRADVVVREEVAFSNEHP